MGNNYFGILFFIFLSVLTSLGMHKKINNILLASLLAATVITLAYQFIGFLVMGAFDPFVLIAMQRSFIVALVIAILTGVPFYLRRRKKKG